MANNFHWKFNNIFYYKTQFFPVREKNEGLVT